MNLYYVHGYSSFDDKMIPILKVHDFGGYDLLTKQVPFKEEFEQDPVNGALVFLKPFVLPYFDNKHNRKNH